MHDWYTPQELKWWPLTEAEYQDFLEATLPSQSQKMSLCVYVAGAAKKFFSRFVRRARAPELVDTDATINRE